MNEYGRLVSYVGAMGSGKTDRLICLYEEMQRSGVMAAIFKPDTVRSGEEGEFVHSRSGKKAPARTVLSLDEIVLFANELGLEVALIDEIQFFDDEEADYTLEALAASGTSVYVFGLDVDSENQTFGMIGEIMAKSDEVFKLQTQCTNCGNPARVSSFDGEKEGIIQVGDLDEYKPLCRNCFYGYGEEYNLSSEPLMATIMIGGSDFTFTFDADVKKMGELGINIGDLSSKEVTLSDVMDILTKIRESKE